MPSVSGLISGLDTTSIIQQLIAIQSQPITTLQSRVKVATSQQTEGKAITAQLLSMKLVADTLSQNATFEAKKVASSNDAVLSATVDSTAAPGAYTFTVGKLAGTSQILSQGFSSQTTAIGTGNLTIEVGNGFVNRKTRVDSLNGGTGIDRGSFKLTDGAGNSTTVDVSAAATVQDILDAINTGATKITASVSADGLVLTDASGAPAITVAEVGGKTTASSLGLTGQSTLNGRLTGSRINKIAGTTRLDDLNDGNGVRTSADAGTGAASTDLRFTVRTGATFDVDIDGTSLKTMQDVLNAVNNAAGNAGKVTAAISADGQSLTMTDNSGGVANPFSITALNSANTLVDLGLSGVTPENTGTGAQDVNGTRIVGKRILAGLDSILNKTLNGGTRQFPGASGGVADGSIAITDRSGTSTTVNLSSRVATTLSGAALATDTSVTLTSAAGFAAGNLIRLSNGASTVIRRITSVNYSTNVVSFDQQLGTALAGGSGAFATNESLSDVTNNIAGRTGNVITAVFNAAGDGLKINDASGGGGLLRIQESGSTTAANLGIKTGDLSGVAPTGGTTTTVVSAALAALGDKLVGLQLEGTAGPNNGYSGKVIDVNTSTNTITLDTAATVAFSGADTVRVTGINAASYSGQATNPAYLTERTQLSSLNGGKGVFAGKIQITDRQGKVFTVDLSQQTRISGVIQNINGAATAATSSLTASIDATGNGILLTSPVGSGTIQVAEVSGGTTAKDLNLLGSSATSTLDGAFKFTVAIGASDTLQTVRDAINALKIPVAASIVSDGSSSAPNRLNLTSQRSGMAGVLVVDALRPNLSFQTVSQAQDASLLFGTSAGGGQPVLFTSSNNTVNNVVPGMTLTLKAASSTPVTETVTRDTDFIAKQMNDFVTGYNAIQDKITQDTSFNPDTNQQGILFSAAGIRDLQTDLSTMLLQVVPGLASNFNDLAAVGIQVNTQGKLSFDQATFQNQLSSDFVSFKKLFVQGADITANTKLGSLRQGNGVRIAGNAVNDFQIKLRDNSVLKVSLSSNANGAAAAIVAVTAAINNATGNGGKLKASVSGDGSGITLVDSSVGSGALTVSSLSGSFAAQDLGIQQSAAFVAGSTSTTLKGIAINTSGVASRMSHRLDFVANDPNGIMSAANSVFDQQIQDMNASIKRMQDQLTQQQQRLEDQFNNLETTLSQLQSMSQFLNTQFQSLASSPSSAPRSSSTSSQAKH